MKNDNLSKAAILRKKAEEVLKNKPPESSSQGSESDVLKLIHELNVHQIELEMQNEELRQAKEREAELATEKYIELYDFAPSGYFTLTGEGEIIDLNLTGAKILGKDRLQFSGSRFGFFVTDETKPVFNLFLKKVIENRVKESCEVILLSDNDIQLYVQLFGIATKNGEQCLVTLNDITERKQAEQLLRESEIKYRSLVETAQELVWRCDASGRFTYLNPAWKKTHGYKLDEMLGKNFSEFQRPEVFERDIIEFTRHLSGGSVKEYETTHIAKNGREITLLFNAIPLVNLEGEIIGTQGTAIDITDRKNAEEEIRKSNELREQLLKHMTEIRENERANISREIHDQLGQSMTALKLDLNWLQANAVSNFEIKEKLSNMVALITETISNVQRISSELRPGILDDLGLAAAIEWYAEEFEKRTKLEVIMDLDEVQTKSDANNLAMFRVLQESLTNVIRHARAKTVKISLHETGQQIVLEIADDGIGIPVEKRKSIRSLGLLGMQERLNQANGTLEISDGDVAGTKIRICIPVEDEFDNSNH